MKPALLVIDMQEVFFDHSPPVAESLTNAIESINAAIAIFRDAAVLFTSGVNPEGKRLILGVSVSLGEQEPHWREFLQIPESTKPTVMLLTKLIYTRSSRI